MLHDICKDSNSTYSGTRLNKETKQHPYPFLRNFYHTKKAPHFSPFYFALISRLKHVSVHWRQTWVSHCLLCDLGDRLCGPWKCTLSGVWGPSLVGVLGGVLDWATGWCPTTGGAFFSMEATVSLAKWAWSTSWSSFTLLAVWKALWRWSWGSVFIKKLDINSIIWWWQGESSNCMFVFWHHSISNMKRWED